MSNINEIKHFRRHLYKKNIANFFKLIFFLEYRHCFATKDLHNVLKDQATVF